MKRFKGIVRNNVVVLEPDVQLPEGAEVEVRLPTRRRKLDQAIARLMANRITRPVGMQEIIEEVKREREEQ
jgi:hypothetical protein